MKINLGSISTIMFCVCIAFLGGCFEQPTEVVENVEVLAEVTGHVEIMEQCESAGQVYDVKTVIVIGGYKEFRCGNLGDVGKKFMIIIPSNHISQRNKLYQLLDKYLG